MKKKTKKFYELQFIIFSFFSFFFVDECCLSRMHTHTHLVLIKLIPLKSDIIVQIWSLTLACTHHHRFPFIVIRQTMRFVEQSWKKWLEGLSKINFLPKLEKKIWYFTVDFTFKNNEKKKTECCICVWQKPATGKKDERREKIYSVIGSFVCYSINCTYQILSAFICSLCRKVEREKDQFGKSIKPLLSLFELSMWWFYLCNNGDKFSLWKIIKKKTFKLGTQSQVPNNYGTLHWRLLQFLVYWNLIYHLKREQLRQQRWDFCTIVQKVFFLLFLLLLLVEVKILLLSLAHKHAVLFKYQFFNWENYTVGKLKVMTEPIVQ